MTNKYLEKIAVTLEMNQKGRVSFVHGDTSEIHMRGDAAKKIPQFPKKQVARAGKLGAVAAVAAGTAAGLTHGAKKLYDKAMKKEAANAGALKSENGRDLIHTGVIGAIGTGTSYLTSRIINGAGHSGNAKAAVLGGALGLAGDFAALKANRKIDTKLDSIP